MFSKIKQIKINQIILIVIFFLFCLTLVGFFNFLVNPYNIFKSPVGKLNCYKLKTNINQYENKILSLKFDNRKIDSVFIGNHKTAYSIDTDYFEKIAGKNCINMGFEDIHLNDYKNYIDLILKIHPEIKNIYLQLDFTMFGYGTNSVINKFQTTNHLTIKDIYKVIFSLTCLKNSILTVFKNIFGQTDNMYWGAIPYSIKNSDNRTDKFFNSLLLNINLYKHFNYNSEKLNQISLLKEYCDNNNIKLHLYIMPTHVMDIQLLEYSELYEQFLIWKENISFIQPFYDFQYPCEYTNENVSNIMKYFYTADIVSTNTGNMILEEIVQDDKDFGRFYINDYAEIFNSSDRSEITMLADEYTTRTKLLNKLWQNTIVNE
ncbi:hypothetical protein IJG14_02640 [bacterium]|nr:hypothetical protein [bacterium]